jgi:Sec-independent protein translocase protein TatA
MKLFNFGVPELLLILMVMVIFLGPERMVEYASKLGKTIYRITHSEVWSSIWQTSREIRNMPKAIVEETGLEESLKDIQATSDELKNDMNAVQSDLKAVKIETGQELNNAQATMVSLTKQPPKTLSKGPVNSADSSVETKEESRDGKKTAQTS